MLKKQRHEIIINEVNSKGAATLKELSLLMKVSESTVRQDVIELDQKNLIRRVHGGAYARDSKTLSLDIWFESREQLEQDAKIKIAKKAAEFVKNKNLIFIDAGTTTNELAKILPNSKLCVVTNSFSIANTLRNKSEIEIILIGGNVKKTTSNVIGSLAIDNLNIFNFDAGFFGANGYDQSVGFTTPELQECLFKKAALIKSKEKFVLLDGSKVNLNYKFSFASNYDDLTLITNANESDINFEKTIFV
ncbi:DeoR/GlpR transcriptional regulator [Mycoplasmopsis anatis]|uniref:Fructose repressor n=1 Tax=Mycoplasmopsis anatis 1340 TaxID=1034808 RepID=F9QCI7_9BACT|nr:DeoR/GlpR family DNA-binding transcription regulator [Mycoplasmopsis anatis]AWX70496.1 DeoR/GlpR transcriptional regulator [Mycoplasmopsis anatis]EGS29521.1 fructose repressor [Mycoplasmopsis anatis 1340]VEU73840.1 transcriptional regulator [Mycoplasmopsis anatis]